MTIRRAEKKDAERINELLFDVAEIHAQGRPDIFRSGAKKYSDEELSEIIGCDDTPIFAAVDDGDRVIGYAFCISQLTEGSLLLCDRRVLYIDDLCVDREERGKHIGTSLYEYVVRYAEQEGYDSVTLNVWAFNESAYKFYRGLGMQELKTVMEKRLK